MDVRRGDSIILLLRIETNSKQPCKLNPHRAAPHSLPPLSHKTLTIQSQKFYDTPQKNSVAQKLQKMHYL